jgi:hypothetical protein
MTFSMTLVIKSTSFWIWIETTIMEANKAVTVELVILYCGVYKAVTTSWHQMLRVQVSATVNNCGLWVWSLNLLDFNSYNYSYSLHKFTTHKPETCLLVWYHFTSYLSCLPMSPLSVSVLTVSRLSLLNCSYLCLHLLKTVFRQPSREHFIEGFSLFVVTKMTPPLCRKRLYMHCHMNAFTVVTQTMMHTLLLS